MPDNDDDELIAKVVRKIMKNTLINLKKILNIKKSQDKWIGTVSAIDNLNGLITVQKSKGDTVTLNKTDIILEVDDRVIVVDNVIIGKTTEIIKTVFV